MMGWIYLVICINKKYIKGKFGKVIYIKGKFGKMINIKGKFGKYIV